MTHRGKASKRCGGDNIKYGRKDIDRCGENICELENSLKLIQRHVTRSRPITFRILPLVWCNTHTHTHTYISKRKRRREVILKCQ